MKTILFRPVDALLFLLLLPLLAGSALGQGVAESYHGQLGYGSGTGMLEKWCALNNFSFEQQGGIEGWIEEGCDSCHVGADWYPDPAFPDCTLCHDGEGFTVNDSGCMNCHSRDTAKRGDLFTPETDQHIAAGLACIDCHPRYEDRRSDHQLLKGMAIDTSEPTMEGALSCTRSCHSSRPHGGGPNGNKLNQHTEKVACETCHIGARPAPALQSRSWHVFDDQGSPETGWKSAGWIPEYKWYDNSGPGAAGDYYLPILGHAERRDVAGARIYPFSVVTVTWFIRHPEAAFHEVIIVPEVKTADSDGDGTVTVEEMRALHPGATLVTADMSFSISHGLMPAERAYRCPDCHGSSGWLLDWQQLGYGSDPGGENAGRQARKGPGPYHGSGH